MIEEISVHQLAIILACFPLCDYWIW